MKYLSFLLACSIMSACTTVNVYSDREPVVILKPSAKNPDNPYDRKRSY